ncbi:uncharacterized protein LOC130737264 [Lotus japonicus]|uniref:uncharacterized protein LOC130737264 n=1 Tax=Lotus japonicus TaxID=34305 RepID=UPI00258A3727|nr:uncharacterized protein LOC130737264 [Lotus japonicus]
MVSLSTYHIFIPTDRNKDKCYQLADKLHLFSNRSSSNNQEDEKSENQDVVKKGTRKASSVQNISDDSVPDPHVDVDQEDDVSNDEATQAINDVLETLADEDRGFDSNSEDNSHESNAEKGDDFDVASHDSSREKTPSESDDEELIKKLASKKATPSASKNAADKKKKKKNVSGAQTPKTPKASQVPVLEKKKKKEKKEEKRRVAVERELSEEALSYTEIMAVIEQAGLMKVVTGLGKCFIQLVREFIVNIPSDCDNEDSVEYRKVFLRGKGIDFSHEVINTYLSRSPGVVTEEEPDLDRVTNTLTGKLTLKHAGSFAVKLPILFPCLLFGLVLQQHPTILRAYEPLALTKVPVAEEEEVDEEAENAEDENAAVEEEEAPYEIVGEEDGESEKRRRRV